MFCSLRPIIIFLDCFLFLADTTANGSYQVLLSQDVFPVFRLFFTFSGDKRLLWFLVLCLSPLSQGVSGFQVPGYAFQRGQLHFSTMLPRPSSQACQHFLCQYFSRHFSSFSNFPPLTRSPLWLLSSPECPAKTCPEPLARLKCFSPRRR